MEKEVSQETLNRYKRITPATIWTALGKKGYENCVMDNVKPLTKGKIILGRARTLRYLPERPDLKEEVREGYSADGTEVPNANAPEYRAMGSCGPGDVLVCDAMGKSNAANLGDVKLIQLKMNKAEGIVTDGGMRDFDQVEPFGFAIYSTGRTPKAARHVMTEYEDNVDIQCDGVLVRPGDVIYGNDDGVVVVPKHMAEEIVEFCELYESAEEYIKNRAEKEQVPPGTYYPPTPEWLEDYKKNIFKPYNS